MTHHGLWRCLRCGPAPQLAQVGDAWLPRLGGLVWHGSRLDARDGLPVCPRCGCRVAPTAINRHDLARGTAEERAEQAALIAPMPPEGPTARARR